MILKRKLSDLDPRASMGAGDAILSLVVLGVLCTGLAFVIFASLIAEIGPGRTAVITYINPIVAVALGVAILGERPGAGAVAGLLPILAGSWLSTDGRLPGLTALAARVRPRRRSRRRAHEPSVEAARA